jgi:serine/threonine protein kinase
MKSTLALKEMCKPQINQRMKQKLQPEIFTSRQERDKSRRTKHQLNTRYKFINYGIFCAGDSQQFFNSIGVPIQPPQTRIEAVRSRWRAAVSSRLFHRRPDESENPVYKTFRYVFENFKKGIYVKICRGELECFLPFTNVNYSQKFDTSKRFADHIKSLEKQAAALDGRTFSPRKIHGHPQRFYFNDGLIRFEYPISEKDTNVTALLDMFRELCAQRKIPDIEFFVNKRDFPLLSQCGSCEPYHNLHGTTERKLQPEFANIGIFTPILSQSKSENHGDILMPTVDDWIRVRGRENSFFSRASNDYLPQQRVRWKDKVPMGFWRGSSTGLGSTASNNQRIHLNEMAQQFPRHLDAGITRWNRRIRKHKDSRRWDFPRGTRTVAPVPWEHQTRWKYLIHVDGHSSAFRLGATLGSGSVVFLVESKWKSFLSRHIIPGKHYIGIKSDLSNLIEKIEWARSHDEECKKIAAAARRFYNQRLNKKGILDYLANTLRETARTRGTFPVVRLHRDDAYKAKNADWCHRQAASHPGPVPNACALVFENKRGVLQSHDGLIYKTSQNVHELQNEFRIGRQFVNELDDPGLSKTHDFRTINGVPTLTKKFIEGHNLLDFIYSRRFEFRRFVAITLDIIRTLIKAQEMFLFVHNDLVPGNVIIDSNGKGTIIDYGKSSAGPIGDRVGLNYELSIFDATHDIEHFFLSSLYHMTRCKYIPDPVIMKLCRWISRTSVGVALRSRQHAKIFTGMQTKFSTMMSRKWMKYERRTAAAGQWRSPATMRSIEKIVALERSHPQ